MKCRREKRKNQRRGESARRIKIAGKENGKRRGNNRDNAKRKKTKKEQSWKTEKQELENEYQKNKSY